MFSVVTLKKKKKHQSLNCKENKKSTGKPILSQFLQLEGLDCNFSDNSGIIL